MISFQPPAFEPHQLLRGGHLQTLATVAPAGPIGLPTRKHVVELIDGDAVVLHETCPPDWPANGLAVLLVHGLSGCHSAPYMIRLAKQFHRQGVRVFRIDMRGCGEAYRLAKQLTHAGRSDDLLAALETIATLAPQGRLGVVAVSLGGNQILRALGRIGAGVDTGPLWIDRLERIVAVCPPIDLVRCSENMQRWILRPYNYYFIRHLMSRIPPGVRARDDFELRKSRPRPRTLRELDEQFTAPLSGFSGALEYYEHSSAANHIGTVLVPTLLLVADDDPVVPVDCFSESKHPWSDSTTRLVSKHGGHVGFIDRQRNCWMDRVILDWFARR
ncbi:putative hydrolase [Novipirellula galeiformis]|uniref:Putative hydrolase n=1 Tax=Novipirellula galeiformis TaxID=2528004 RepID=A0A5C6CVA5_9BACT|nr:alpha/beta fold hydrolase [Novipirellula galeiformis]TWU26896.1 putative hydrolase [Novipirellula galeiformis]